LYESQIESLGVCDIKLTIGASFQVQQMRVGRQCRIFRRHTYLQTKTPHNFHLINQNGTFPSFPNLYKSKEPIPIFYLKKSDL